MRGAATGRTILICIVSMGDRVVEGASVVIPMREKEFADAIGSP